METLKVLSIDIGIKNLGYVYCKMNLVPPEINKYKARLINNDYTLNKSNTLKNIRVLDCNRVDITHVKHNLVKYCDCKLHHDNCIPDYLDHFIQETPHFEECDVLILERQPPVGITNVQDLLFTKFREKVLLISPGSIHKFFNFNSEKVSDETERYNARKEKSECVAQSYLTNYKTFTTNIRKHDIADALLMIIYYYTTQMERIIENSLYVKDPTCIDFEEFKYTL